MANSERDNTKPKPIFTSEDCHNLEGSYSRAIKRKKDELDEKKEEWIEKIKNWQEKIDEWKKQKNELRDEKKQRENSLNKEQLSQKMQNMVIKEIRKKNALQDKIDMKITKLEEKKAKALKLTDKVVKKIYKTEQELQEENTFKKLSSGQSINPWEYPELNQFMESLENFVEREAPWSEVKKWIKTHLPLYKQHFKIIIQEEQGSDEETSEIIVNDIIDYMKNATDIVLNPKGKRY